MSRLNARTVQLAVIGLATAFAAAAGTGRVGAEQSGSQDTYRPQLAVPETLEPYLPHIEPGNDAFPAERQAKEIEARLRELRDSLRASPARASSATEWLLDPGFRGGRLLPVENPSARAPSNRPLNDDARLEIRRAKLPGDLSLDAASFGRELQRLVEGLRAITVAEFLVTSIEANDQSPLVRTVIRYDIVGTGTKAWRVEHVGVWQMSWRRASSGWRVVEWTADSLVSSRAPAPVFTEVTEAALGGNDSFRRQLSIDLDAWMATFDSVLTRDSNGHHGVSVGDADGDGLDDFYVAQPSGLPNRLYRARGDGTFEDATERAGLGVLDDTAQSLFADVDNDGDQDLVLATGTKPLLFLNDKGRFSVVADAFQFQQPLQGVLTSIAMADYDRDGFLDLYLCVYSYFFGAGEDKAGTPAPYYDARNGPPAVLFRNDGRGRFVDVTAEAGLDAGNDRYHFAAAWADYDNDGWPDLLVANDFGAKNLYHNRGLRDGRVTFEDVAADAGVLDHGAGMSAAFLDYDNDGLLDIYTGNMWSDAGLRVTSAPGFIPDAPPNVRALYRRHVRGNSLLRNRGDGHFEDKTLAARAEMGRWAWSSDALDFDNDGWEDLYVVNGMLTREVPAARASANARARASDSLEPPVSAKREAAAAGVGPRGSEKGGAPRALSEDAQNSPAPNAERRTPASDDLEGFFWRQVVARSPLTRVKNSPYDDAWRAINELLIHGSIASRQRNVFLRNDGQGGFDEVSGSVGLDLDQDGRSFAVLDIDRDGDEDLLVMAARQAPHLRVFQNDFAPKAASLAVRLVGSGSKSNRDAIGARVVVETDRMRRTKVVQAGSGFLSQRSKELLFGLGESQRVVKLTIAWPSGATQTITDVPLNTRVRIVEGGATEHGPFAVGSAPRSASSKPAPSVSAGRSETWLFEPFPAPDFSLQDLGGQPRSLAALRGRPVVLLFWSAESSRARGALQTLTRGHATLTKAGVSSLAIALDAPANLTQIKSAATDPSLPVVVATPEMGLSYAIVNRHLFMNRQDMRLPTTLLLDQAGQIVKVYRDDPDIPLILRDVAAIEAIPAERLSRAVPFPGTFYSPPPLRNYLPYGRELLDQGLERAAVEAFERAALANPTPSTLYRLGTLLAKSGEASRARAAFERALALQPDLAEANNDLGALLAQEGNLPEAIQRFRAALASAPDYPDALNNLGYALLLSGSNDEARGLYEKAIALQPDFPEALNNLGLLYGRAGDMDRAERHFRDALSRRSTYGEAANNLALVLVSKGQTDAAVQLLEGFLEKTPQYQDAYVTLAKIHFSVGRSRDGVQVLERLLQRNPKHPAAIELLRQWKGH